MHGACCMATYAHVLFGFGNRRTLVRIFSYAIVLPDFRDVLQNLWEFYGILKEESEYPYYSFSVLLSDTFSLVTKHICMLLDMMACESLRHWGGDLCSTVYLRKHIRIAQFGFC